MYAYSLFSLAFAKCPLNVFSALAFVSILGGFGKFTYLIGGIQLYKLSFKEGEIYEISSETRESPHASCSSTADLPAITVSKTPSFRTGYPSSAANAV